MPDDLLGAVRAALPGSRINDKTLLAIIGAVEQVIRAQQPPPAQPGPPSALTQIGWQCNGEVVAGGMTVEPAPHWLPLYVGERS